MLSSSGRLTRFSIALIATLAALAGTAGSAQAAAPCDEGFTSGNKLCLATTHEPAGNFVIPDGYIRYTVHVANPGPATATKATLTFTLDTHTTLEPTVPLPQGCTRTAPSVSPTVVTCSLGSIKPTGAQPITRSFVVKAPGFETSTSAVARISADARQSDKQDNPNDPTSEDFADAPEVVAVDLVNGQSASFIPQNKEVTLDTDPNHQGATPGNPQSAVFTLFASSFSTAAVIQDEDDAPAFECPKTLKCPSAGWVRASIPGLFTFPSSMLIELHYDATAFKDGITESGYVMFHLKDNATTAEPISRPCSKNPPPCLVDVDIDKNGDLTAIAKGTENSRYR